MLASPYMHWYARQGFLALIFAHDWKKPVRRRHTCTQAFYRNHPDPRIRVDICKAWDICGIWEFNVIVHRAGCVGMWRSRRCRGEFSKVTEYACEVVICYNIAYYKQRCHRLTRSVVVYREYSLLRACYSLGDMYVDVMVLWRPYLMESGVRIEKDVTRSYLLAAVYTM